MKIQEFTGKTTQEAIDNGLAELGVTIADVHVDVLQEGAKGLFGLFGSKPARVRLTIMEEEREDDHGLSDLIGSLSLNDQAKKKPQPKPAVKAEPAKPAAKPEAPKAAPKAEAVKPAPKAEPVKAEAPKAEPKPVVKTEAPKAEAEQAEKPEAPKPAREPKERKPRPPRTPKEKTDVQPEEKRDYAPMVPAETFAPTEPPVIFGEDTPAGRAQKFLMDVTERMGVKVDVYVNDSEPDSLSIHMIGDTLGILIGRRGETLDALQYLTSLQVNKGREGYIRVTLDTENYRAKREDSLRRLAQRMANRAVKTGRKVVLEPMNPYERRVLHTALQNHPSVTTHSEGEEPNRRVVIILKNQPERADRQDKQDKPQGDKPRRSRSRRRGPRKPTQNAAQTAPQTDGQNAPELIITPESPAPVDALGVEE